MTGIERPTAVGLFNNELLARQALTELRRAGFPEEGLGFVARHSEASPTQPLPGQETMASEGAATGAAGAAWAVAATGAMQLPGIGSVLVGGRLLGAMLVNTAGGVPGALVSLGIPEEEAAFYEDELKAGQTLATVSADGRHDDAVALLRRYGGYDITARRAAVAAGEHQFESSQAEQGVLTRAEPLTSG